MNPRTLVRVQPPELDAEVRALHALSDDAFIALMRKARQRPEPEPDGATLAEVFALEAAALAGRCFALTVANAHAALALPEDLHVHVFAAPRDLHLHVSPRFASEFLRLTGAHRSATQASTLVLPSPYGGKDAIVASLFEPPESGDALVWWSVALGDDDARIFVASLSCLATTPRTVREWNAARGLPLVASSSERMNQWTFGQFAHDEHDEEPRGTARVRYVPRVVIAGGFAGDATVVETPWGALTARDVPHAHAVREHVIADCTFAYEVPVLP